MITKKVMKFLVVAKKENVKKNHRKIAMNYQKVNWRAVEQKG